MKRYVRSFINERTVEFLLVPQLTAALKKVYPVAIPFFFWATREGGTVVKENLDGRYFKIMVFYPRRPKVFEADSNRINVKINQLIFDRANYYVEKKIPVICGVPLIKNIMDLHTDSKSYWLQVGQNGSEQELELFLSAPNSVDFQGLRGFEDFSFIDQFGTFCQEYCWNEVLEIIKELRSTYRYHGYTLFGDQYKPVYFLLESEDNWEFRQN